MEDVIAGTRDSSALTEPMISEEITAVFSAIPSVILTYISIHWDCFPSSVWTATYILAFAIGGTLALQFEALRLPIRSRIM
jgi:hypothetical protein